MGAVDEVHELRPAGLNACECKDARSECAPPAGPVAPWVGPMARRQTGPETQARKIVKTQLPLRLPALSTTLPCVVVRVIAQLSAHCVSESLPVSERARHDPIKHRAGRQRYLDARVGCRGLPLSSIRTLAGDLLGLLSRPLDEKWRDCMQAGSGVGAFASAFQLAKCSEQASRQSSAQLPVPAHAASEAMAICPARIVM